MAITSGRVPAELITGAWRSTIGDTATFASRTIPVPRWIAYLLQLRVPGKRYGHESAFPTRRDLSTRYTAMPRST
jgi:hypothetical protein